MVKVVIESPLSSDTPEGFEENRRYARACMRDSLMRGEAPYASHLLYDQPGILDDRIKAERELGMMAGFRWGAEADTVIVYQDLGISPGMAEGIRRAAINNKQIIYRNLPDWYTVPKV